MGQGNAKADGKLAGAEGTGHNASAATPDSDKHSSAKPIVKPTAGAGGGGGGGGAGSQPTNIVLDGGSGSGSGSGSNSLDAMGGAGGGGGGGGGGLKIGISGDGKDLMGGTDGPGALPMGTPSSLTDRVARIISKEAAQQSAVNGIQLSLPMSQSPKLDDLLVPEPKQIETVSTLFKWSGGGNDVFLTGSFNNWQGKIRMTRTTTAAGANAAANGAVSVSGGSGGPSPSTSALTLSAAAGGGSTLAPMNTAADNAGPGAAAAGAVGAGGGASAQSVVEFVLVIDIPPGVHQYKYIVDEQWRINADAPTTTNPQGVVNNIIEVKRPVFEDNLSAFADSDEEELDENKQKINYGQRIPATEEYSKDPPKIPPQLGNILLNAPVSPADPYILPIPQHVTLNHMYVYGYGKNPGESEVLVTGITQRFKTKSFINNTPKFVTTVYYQKLLPTAG